MRGRPNRAWIELNMEHLLHNVQALKSLVPAGCELMPVVKANAYGHGAALIAKELSRHGLRRFCVASIEEGIELRKSGINGTILILGYTHPDLFPLLRKYHLTQTAIDPEYAKQLESCGHKLHVHVKIDTGMHRLGFAFDKGDDLLSLWNMKNLIIDGIYTHLCCDETREPADKNYTGQQSYRFQRVLSFLDDRHLSYGKKHILASYGILNYPQFAGDLIRPGITLYGVFGKRSHLASSPIELKPVLTLKARISLIRDVHPGETVGYGQQFTADTNCRIAVLSIGYADGFPRELSNGKGNVLINGYSCPTVGVICMDQMMVNITDVPDARAGDTAVLIGRSGDLEISVYDLAEQCHTITNEILSRLGKRLPRIT
ncbi:MAG: serine racemase VanT catalytic subunit [Parasporobacterium sp.]|nr:serine racemase VanT catalytic subunit [Parasporobacterium sp.]